MRLFDSPVNILLLQAASPLQVVAGTNYKLLLDIATSQNKKERLEAVVYGGVLCKPTGILEGRSFPLSVGGSCLEAAMTVCRASGWPGDEAVVIPHSQP